MEITCGGRYGGKNMYVLNDTIINTILTMKEDSSENKIWREDGGNIKAQV